MPNLMLKRKTCGEVFDGIYVPKGGNIEDKTMSLNTDASHTCSRGHNNDMLATINRICPK
jgi:hypothetical protein